MLTGVSASPTPCPLQVQEQLGGQFPGVAPQPISPNSTKDVCVLATASNSTFLVLHLGPCDLNPPDLSPATQRQ